MTITVTNETRKKYLHLVKKDLQDKVKAIKEDFFNDPSGMKTTQAYTLLVDNTIASIYKTFRDEYPSKKSSTVPSLSIIAVGGYGRGELNIHSDIDILFLYETKADPFVDFLLNNVLSLLWDIGLEVGHSFRTINDCLTMARKDIKSLTALMESRLISGDNKLYSKFQSAMKKYLHKKEAHRFIFEHIHAKKSSDSKNNHSIFSSEPNIKESPGGLRDIHCALWATRAIFALGTLEELHSKNVLDTHEFNTLKSSMDLIIKIRNALHIFTKNKNDILVHEVQNEVTNMLAYKSNSNRSGVDFFMRDYYSAAYNLNIFSNVLIHRCLEYRGKTKKIFQRFRLKDLGKDFTQSKDEISLKNFNETAFIEKPSLLFNLFLYALQFNLKINENLKNLIRKNAPLIKDHKWPPSDLRQFILTLMKAKNTSVALRTMDSVDVLGLFLPEFGKCRFQIHNDFFHTYTVDEHSLHAVETLENLCHSKKKELDEVSQVYQSLSKPEILKFSLLIHDIGKAEGADHIKTGLIYADNIIKRLVLEAEDARTIIFLIKNHLLMNHVAQRRDLSDRKTIKDFAEKIKDIELLKMLYAHTCADIMAVSPGMLTEWKGALLLELYQKTYDYLMMDDSVDRAEQALAMKRKQKVLSKIPQEEDKEFARIYLKNMPIKYLVSFSSDSIIKHVFLVKQLDKEIVSVDFSRNNKFNYWELSVCTKGKTGTLAKITGVLSAGSLNILNAQLYSGKDGLAIDTLQINEAGYRQVSTENSLKKIERELKDVLSNKKDVSDIIKSKRFLKSNSLKKHILIPTTVLIDNKISENYSVFEVIFQDRIGSLYLLTKTFSDLGINIVNAKISTQGKKGFDVFYVTDLHKNKILDDKKLLNIKSSLEKSLDNF